MNYYNDTDPYVCEWLRNLIHAGLIPPGDVDERSIECVQASDLAGYTQCHFFAGIAGWPLALQLAGVPASTPLWTGSCPCQPFSTAGSKRGTDDERHLWPAFAQLIEKCKPPIVVGEQVASSDVNDWIDHVLADLERMDYAAAAVAYPVAGIGAPHLRDRCYWIGVGHGADAYGTRLEGRREPQRQRTIQLPAGPSSMVGRVADTNGNGRSPITLPELPDTQRYLESRGGTGRVADAERGRSASRCIRLPEPPTVQLAENGITLDPNATHGFWQDADWIYCRDDKWRPVEPGTFPLADGVPARMGRTRAYGNAINPYAAATFLRAALQP